MRDRLLEVFVAGAIEEVPALEVRVVRLRIDGAGAGQPRPLGRRELHVDLAGDRRRELALEREYVARAALEAPGPEVLVRPGVDQLRRDPDFVAGSDHRSL